MKKELNRQLYILTKTVRELQQNLDDELSLQVEVKNDKIYIEVGCFEYSGNTLEELLQEVNDRLEEDIYKVYDEPGEMERMYEHDHYMEWAEFK